jgi:DNA-binding NtrC family response regulator
MAQNTSSPHPAELSLDTPFKILVVDSDAESISRIAFVLETVGITNTLGCRDRGKTGSLIPDKDVGIVLLDLSDSFFEGESLLDKLTTLHPQIPFIVTTSDPNVEIGIRAYRSGAFDFMVKPINPSRLVESIRRAVEFRRLQGGEDDLDRSSLLKNPEAFQPIVTRNRSMLSLFQYLEAVAPTSRPILVMGETGVGKEMIARAIHVLSGRKGPYLAVNIAGLDDHSFSDTLFGHLKGAFTGADSARDGLVKIAAQGTLVLDEIGDLNFTNQVKLLRLLQEGEYFPLGADSLRPANTRFILITNQDLHSMQLEGSFRSDLYHRLQTHRVIVPPLRERLEDLPLLLDHFIGTCSSILGKRKPTPPPELLQLLMSYPFPGNVRELESMVFDAVSRHKSRMLSMQPFLEYIEHRRNRNRGAAPRRSVGSEENPFASFEELPTLKDSTRLLLKEALRRGKGSRTTAARLLGITRSGLSKALKRNSLD